MVYNIWPLGSCWLCLSLDKDLQVRQVNKYYSNYLKFCFLFSQVWFQNRRAKFRRNERNMLAQRNALYGGRPMIEPQSPLEQPIAARPSPVNADYLSWTATAAYSPMSPAQYSPMGAHTMPPCTQTSPNTSSSCALAGNANYSMAPPPPPMSMSGGGAMGGASGGGGGGASGGGITHNGMGGLGTSIASLRLKAQEYNMQQTRYPIQHQMAQ